MGSREPKDMLTAVALGRAQASRKQVPQRFNMEQFATKMIIDESSDES